MRGRRLLLAAVMVIASVVFAGTAQALTLQPDFELKTVASGLNRPTAIALAPDGRMFVAEHWGKVRVVTGGQTLAAPLLDISDHVNHAGDRGLVGLEVDRDFATNHYLYLAYTYEGGGNPVDDGPKTSRLTRVTVRPDNTVVNPSDPETMILGADGDTPPCADPANDNDCMATDVPAHTIGGVRADQDGSLWVGVADGAGVGTADAHSLRAQDETSLNGKILHIDRSGKGLPGHPFCPDDDDLSHVCTKLYAKGFRNPFRFGLRDGQGPIVGDVGFNTMEELDLTQSGKDYGWPCWEGTVQTPGWGPRPECASHYAPGGTTVPDWAYGRDYGRTIIGGPIYPGGDYPAPYHGGILVADWGNSWIRSLKLGSGGPQITPLLDGDSPVDIELLPDGNLVYLTWGDFSATGGQVIEVAYCPDNCAPVARATATPEFGPVPLTVHFDAGASTDSDGDQLAYDWDFGDGSAHSSAVAPDHEYDMSGVHTATLTVTDPGGLSDTKSIPIAAGDTPPIPTIETPADESKFTDGVPVTVKGSAADAEDGLVDPSKLVWTVLLHHGNHVHPFDSVPPGSGGQFTPLKDHDADSYYAITLTAHDSSGVAGSTTIHLRPRTVPLVLDSSPPGAQMSYAGTAVLAPFATNSAIGLKATISTSAAFTSHGRRYVFRRWSDGGALGHDITIGEKPIHLTARYRDVSEHAGPLLSFDADAAPARARAGKLVVSATDPSGVRDVSLALRQPRKDGCRWWRRDLGRLSHRTTSCAVPRWIAAERGPRQSRHSWRANLGAGVRRGHYEVVFRAVDRLGNVSRRADGRKRIAFVVRRSLFR